VESHPLLVTRDPGLVEELHRLAAAAGTGLRVCAEPVELRRRWLAAPLVLVGADSAAPLAELRLPRREHVAIVCRHPVDVQLWSVAVALGADRVVALPGDAPPVVELIADAVEGRPATAPLVAVVGACGGAGASTLAAVLAASAARRGRPTMLIDGDPLGGGIDLVFGKEQAPGARWAELAATSGRVSARSLRSALPGAPNLLLLSCDRGQTAAIDAAVMAALLAAAVRTVELVVVDLPRQLGDAGQLALSRARLALLLVPARVRAVAAAAVVAAQLSAYCADVRLVVRRAPRRGLRAASIGDSLGLRLAGSIPHASALAAGEESGGRVLRRHRGFEPLCSAVLAELRGPGAAA
jgi:secretion/DNA translocation related CpaE-like protein